MRSARILPFLLAFSFCGGCSSSAASGDAGVVYTPYVGDFCDYKSWTTYVEPDAGGDGIIAPSATSDGGFVHVGGERIEYINQIPPHGSTEFPIGTIIVKVIPAQDQIFAMAKRGGGYNSNGPNGAAINWEWFELSPTDCSAGFIWSGAFPPSNQSYGGTPTVCNDCHAGYLSNDYVASPKILLKDY